MRENVVPPFGFSWKFSTRFNSFQLNICKMHFKVIISTFLVFYLVLKSSELVIRFSGFESIPDYILDKNFMITHRYVTFKSFCILHCSKVPKCLSIAFGFGKCLIYSISPHFNHSESDDVIIPAQGFQLFAVPRNEEPSCLVDGIKLVSSHTIRYYCNLGPKIEDSNHEWSSWVFDFLNDTSSLADVRTRRCFDPDPSVIFCPTCLQREVSRNIEVPQGFAGFLLSVVSADILCVETEAKLLGDKNLINKLIDWNKQTFALSYSIWTGYRATITLKRANYLFSFEYGDHKLNASDPWLPGLLNNLNVLRKCVLLSDNYLKDASCTNTTEVIPMCELDPPVLTEEIFGC